MSLLLLLPHEYADSLFSASIEETLGLGTARNEWAFVLATSSGAPYDVLDPAILNAELTYSRSEATTLNLTLQGEDDRAYNIIYQLTQTAPRVYAYRDSVLYFAGQVVAIKESAEEDLAMVVTCVDALATLQHRLTELDFEAYEENASYLIAGTLTDGQSSLLAQANATATTGLAAGTVTSSIGVDTFATSRDVCYDKLRELCQLVTGPDVKVRPVDGGATYGYLDVGNLYVSSATVASFGYGAGTLGNLTSFEWEVTPPLTRVICLGSETEGASTVDANVTTAEAKVGVWQGQVSNNDLYLETDCVNAANAAVRLDWTTAVTFTPDPAVTPRPLRDYNVGDLVGVRAKRGSMLYNGNLRVRSIGVTIDDSGLEVAHRLECEAGAPGTGQQTDATGLTIAATDSAAAGNNLGSSFT